MDNNLELDRKIASILIPYLDTMKSLENINDYQEREGKKAVRLIMAINDFKNLIEIEKNNK